MLEVRVQRWVFDVHRNVEYFSIDADLTFNRVVIKGFAIVVGAVEGSELGPVDGDLELLLSNHQMRFSVSDSHIAKL